jgi:hypothetical protein
VEATSGSTLAQFAAESLDFVYSYAVFQHIPSREVVLSYMHEVVRVLRPGGVFRAQFNGLPHDRIPDTWSGVTFSADDLKAFALENGFQIFALEGIDTQYLWTTWVKKGRRPYCGGDTLIRRITNAHTSETLVPASGRHAVAAIWVVNLDAGIDLNNLDVTFEGVPGIPYYIGPELRGNLRQINVRLPAGLRTGLVPVHMCGTTKWIRVVPPGPMTPRIVSVRDGINLVAQNRTTSGYVKVVLEEIRDAKDVSITIDARPVPGLQLKCTDPVPPRFEANFAVPERVDQGTHWIQIRVRGRSLMPHPIVIESNPG